MADKLYLGIDMGGTHIKIAIVDVNGSILEETVMDTDIKEKPVKVIEAIIKKASELTNYKKTSSIGVGIAGDINCEKGIVRFSPNLPMWKNIPLQKILQEKTKKKAFVDNDANTAGIGAFWLDAKAKSKNLICVTLGTGVGGGLIFDKKLYRGASCTAGEIGHITIDYKGNKCKCGNTGCIETYVGANYLSNYARKYLENKKSKIISQLTSDNHSKITPKILYAAAVKGDKAAIEIWKYTGEKLGILLAGLLNFFNPDTIVLCGGVSQAGNFLLGPAKKEMEKRAFKSALKSCKVVVSKYTHKLGVVGAAMLPETQS